MCLWPDQVLFVCQHDKEPDSVCWYSQFTPPPLHFKVLQDYSKISKRAHGFPTFLFFWQGFCYRASACSAIFSFQRMALDQTWRSHLYSFNRGVLVGCSRLWPPVQADDFGRNRLYGSIRRMLLAKKARFRSRPVLGRLRLREFFIQLRLLVKANIIFGFFKTDYELSKICSNTCTSTCKSYFMFTLEKTSNDVKFHVIFVNY